MNYYETTQLQYPDEAKYTTIDSVSSKDIPRVSVTEEYNRLLANPHMVVLAEPGGVEFFNSAPKTLSVDLQNAGTAMPELSVEGNSGAAFSLDGPGAYSFFIGISKGISGDRYGKNTYVSAVVLSGDMEDLARDDKMEISKLILIASDLPIVGMSQDGQKSVNIQLDPAINELLPESRQYYLDAARSIVPFEIGIGLY